MTDVTKRGLGNQPGGFAALVGGRSVSRSALVRRFARPVHLLAVANAVNVLGAVGSTVED